jgi:hypothetical protein
VDTVDVAEEEQEFIEDKQQQPARHPISHLGWDGRCPTLEILRRGEGF